MFGGITLRPTSVGIPVFQEIGIDLASGFVLGDGTAQVINGATVTRADVGRYDITLDTPLPNGNYEVFTQAHEEDDNANRDGVDSLVVQGSQSGAGFRIMCTTGDNGGGADPYVDAPFSFEVNARLNVVVNVV